MRGTFEEERKMESLYVCMEGEGGVGGGSLY